MYTLPDCLHTFVQNQDFLDSVTADDFDHDKYAKDLLATINVTLCKTEN